jgi:hypothetical protein
MRAHQPGSTPIDIPETVPNPAHTPAPAPAPERAPTKVPDKVPEKVIAPASFDVVYDADRFSGGCSGSHRIPSRTSTVKVRRLKHHHVP